MIAESLAGSTRTSRGIALFLRARQGVEQRTRHELAVPSCTDADVMYLCNVKTGRCECPDSPRAVEQGEVCKHIVCARLTMQHRAELRTRCQRERTKS